jgi:diguanylate cyclase (GGDEF)-like protein
MRVWIALICAIAMMAGAVLYASEAERKTADVNLRGVQAAFAIRDAMLAQERAVDDYLVAPKPELLVDYAAAARRLRSGLEAARRVARNDAQELAAIEDEARYYARWRALAQQDIAAAQGSGPHGISPRDTASGRQVMKDFLVANDRYTARLDTVRRSETREAALVPVWLIVGLSLVFGGVGAYVVRRAKRARASEEAAKAAQRAREEELASSQARFAEAMQVAENQAEAQDFLRTHLERVIPGGAVVILNRNNSANRLEAVTPLEPDDLLVLPLRQSKPRSCLAVRLSRRYSRYDGDGEVLTCEVCGVLGRPSSCQPLLVGGEVIGSVLVSHEERLSPEGEQLLGDSVGQDAPELANLRNLAIAETRAATDALTGLPNKRSVDDTLKRMLAEASRTVSPLSLVMLDLDHFKQINDRYGHERGNEVLAALGVLLRNAVRASDFVGRTGGEEFVIFLPATDRAGALELAEKVRRAVRRLHISGIESSLSASLGVAVFPDDATDGATLMRYADRALYVAKQHGRDRVETTSTGAGAARPAPAAEEVAAQLP